MNIDDMNPLLMQLIQRQSPKLASQMMPAPPPQQALGMWSQPAGAVKPPSAPPAGGPPQFGELPKKPHLPSQEQRAQTAGAMAQSYREGDNPSLARVLMSRV